MKLELWKCYWMKIEELNLMIMIILLTSFLSTWSNHVKSWTKINSFKTILIKYEDLEHDNEEILKSDKVY